MTDDDVAIFGLPVVVRSNLPTGTLFQLVNDDGSGAALLKDGTIERLERRRPMVFEGNRS